MSKPFWSFMRAYPPPPPPPPVKNSGKKLYAIVIVTVLIVAAIVGAYALTNKGWTDSTNPKVTPTTKPTSTTAPNPTSTVTPTATATTLQKPEILSKTSYTDELGYFNVVGEVKNTLSTNINYVKIVATFYDSSNTVIGTSFTFTDVDILEPNQKSPFQISSYPEKISPATYKLTVDYDVTGDTPYQGLTILSNTASIDSLGYHKVVGEVKNSGIRESTYVEVISTYYDSTGKVIGKSYTFTDPDSIAVGNTAPFELSSYPLALNPARYELQVQGS
jgi:hypothetical protein